MGFDCTLHVIDPAVLAGAFSRRLLGQSATKTPLDRVHKADAPRLWKTVGDALASGHREGPSDAGEAASLVCQLAVMYSACSLPHHYERGFALSLWPELDRRVRATVPRELTESPQLLFPAVVRRHKQLVGKFPRAFTGNYSTGVYLPPRAVAKAHAWARERVAQLPDDDRAPFWGLLYILREAARRELAYWEATDMVVPIADQHGGKASLMTADFLKRPAPREQLPVGPADPPRSRKRR